MRREQNTSTQMGFYLEAVIMILVFAVVLTILTRVFARAAQMTHEAHSLTCAVTECRNVAEALAIREDYESVYTPSLGEDLIIQVEKEEEPAAAGKLIHYTIQAIGQEENPVYTLETTVFYGE